MINGKFFPDKIEFWVFCDNFVFKNDNIYKRWFKGSQNGNSIFNISLTENAKLVLVDKDENGIKHCKIEDDKFKIEIFMTKRDKK